MSHSFLVLHFAGQCPWLPWTIAQARQAAMAIGGDSDVVDVAARPELARQYGLYFPFLTIIDNRIRISAPTPAAGLLQLIEPSEREGGQSNVDGASSEPESALPTEDATADRVDALTFTNVAESCALCNAPVGGGCKLKVEWAGDRAATLPHGILGYIAYADNEPVAVVEALPASHIPYPLPVDLTGAAFITCVYPTRVPDYRGAALDRLLAELPGLGYRRVLVVSGRRTPFPNGPSDFFSRHGFREVCTLISEQLRNTAEELVLMERVL